MRPTTKAKFTMNCGGPVRMGFSGFDYYRAKTILEQSMVLAALNETNGNKTNAAFKLGISRAMLIKIYKAIDKSYLNSL